MTSMNLDQERKNGSKRGRFESLRKRQIHVADGLVDLLRALEADRCAIHPRILESKPHGIHTVLVTGAELTTAAELHADHPQPIPL